VDEKRAARTGSKLSAQLREDELDPVHVLSTVEFVGHLDSLDERAEGAPEQTIRGYRVNLRHKTGTDGEQAAREATLSSPRSPSITIRIFSSAENRRRVLRRMSRTAFSADSFLDMGFLLLSEPGTLSYLIGTIGPTSADGSRFNPKSFRYFLTPAGVGFMDCLPFSQFAGHTSPDFSQC
jgi:hypothetical protein